MPDAPPVTIALPCVPHHLFPMQAETGRAWTGIPVEARRRAAASCGGRSAATPTLTQLVVLTSVARHPGQNNDAVTALLAVVRQQLTQLARSCALLDAVITAFGQTRPVRHVPVPPRRAVHRGGGRPRPAEQDGRARLLYRPDVELDIVEVEPLVVPGHRVAAQQAIEDGERRVVAGTESLALDPEPLVLGGVAEAEAQQ
jgi:hypothetical protein